MGEPELKRMTADEFLVWQQSQDRKYELVDGLPVLHRQIEPGCSRSHDCVTVNVLSALHHQVRGTHRRAATKNIPIRLPNGGLRRSEALVDSRTARRNETVAHEPELAVDVFTPGRISFSRMQKIDEYKAVPSLAYILIIASEQPQMMLYSRFASGWTSRTFTSLDAVIDLPAIDCRLAARDLFEGLPFAG